MITPGTEGTLDQLQNEEVLWTIKKHRLMVMPLITEDGNLRYWAVGQPDDELWFMIGGDDLTVDGHIEIATGRTLHEAVMKWCSDKHWTR